MGTFEKQISKFVSSPSLWHRNNLSFVVLSSLIIRETASKLFFVADSSLLTFNEKSPAFQIKHLTREANGITERKHPLPVSSISVMLFEGRSRARSKVSDDKV